MSDSTNCAGTEMGAIVEAPPPNQADAAARQCATGRDSFQAGLHDDGLNPNAGLMLTPGQLYAIDLLSRGRSVAQVAEELGVHRGTVYRWQHDDAAFRGELLRRQRELLAHATDRLRALIDPAITVLAAELNEPKTAHRAATALLRLAACK